MGFPPGHSEQLLGHFYLHYKKEHEKKFPSKGEALVQRWLEHEKKIKAAREAKANAKAEADKTAAEDSQTKTGAAEGEEEKKSEDPAPAKTEIPSATPAAATVTANTVAPVNDMVGPSKPATTAADQPLVANALPGRCDVIDKTISTYNGGVTSKYKWAQQIFNVDVQIAIPKGTTARGIIVDIKAKHLKVHIKGQETPLIDGELFARVKKDDSFWNIEDNEYLNINLEKLEE